MQNKIVLINLKIIFPQNSNKERRVRNRPIVNNKIFIKILLKLKINNQYWWIYYFQQQGKKGKKATKAKLGGVSKAASKDVYQTYDDYDNEFDDFM